MTPAWDPSRPSIHATLLGARVAGGRVAAVELPDEEAVAGPEGLRFVPGLRDALARESPGAARALLDTVVAAVRGEEAGALPRLYGLATRERIVGVVDEVIAGLAPELGLNPARFDALFSWLARSAPDREPVKLALAMLGRLRGARHLDLFRLLGSHDEFTAFAAVAIASTLPAGEARAELERLAREVTGWGRIDLVRRLADGTGDEGFRRWLLREGFRNDIDDRELALVAAREGDLLGQLLAPGATEDAALIDGAAGILRALTEGGPDAGMEDYAQGAEAAQAWLGLAEGRTPSLERAATLAGLLGQAAEGGWAEAEAAEIGRRAVALLRAPATVARIERALRDGDREEWRAARAAAREAGVDPWPFAFGRQASGDGEHWSELMETGDADRIDRVLGLALRLVPLDEVATGPADDLGLGPGREAQRAVDFLVQGLRRFPGRGWPFVAAALRSPVTRNRTMAVRALGDWGRGTWPPEAEPALRRALAEEPREDLRGRVAALLAP